MNVLCFFGLHDWADHQVHNEWIYSRPYAMKLYDRVCLRCMKEDRLAGKLRAKLAAQEQRRESAMNTLRELKQEEVE